ncbi:hypothetical protein HYT00_02905 [Candidatus Giovannonibacteria bacterium]|nr:hypothetical protein [Candidatus Giovannonibacteria bacterium]
MKRQISKKIKKDHYHSSAAIVWCFDARFSGLLEKHISKKKLYFPDIIKIAGGAKALATPENKNERDYILSQIEKSFKLHHPKEIYLMVHANCGAYGKNFIDEKSEKKFYLAELEKAEKNLKNFLSRKKIEARVVKCFADFEGISF